MDEEEDALDKLRQARAVAAASRAQADTDAKAADQAAIAAYEAGANLRQLAEAMGIRSIEGARKVLNKNDVKRRRRGAPDKAGS